MDSLAWGSGGATYCEKFVEDMTGCGWQGVSAIDAWQRNVARHAGLDGAQVGDALYFGPATENEGYGHTGILTAEDTFCSVTYYGVKVYAVSAWGAPLLGWIRYWA